MSATNEGRTSAGREPLLHLFKNAICAQVRADTPDLSSRQIGVFLTSYLDDPEGGHTVRGMAAHLNISKPAVTRALDRLAEFDFIRRETDPHDRRSVLVKKTPKGTVFLRTFGGFLRDAQKATTKAAA
jgi:DNA-binding MarR family transcriptional regulator